MKTKQLFDTFRERYIKDLSTPVSYDGGKTFRQKSAKIPQWEAIPYCEPVADPTKHKTWVWSDQHLGHKNIIGFSNRPYPDVDTMNEHLVLNFVDSVQPDDISIWVGDVAFLQDSRANQLLHRCPGYKILVVGNHDFDHGKVKKLHFDEIHIVYPVEIDGVQLIFTHYPMSWIPHPWINVHGHEHVSKNNLKSSPLRINVNVEFHQYKPIELTDIIGWAKTRVNSAEKDDWKGDPIDT